MRKIDAFAHILPPSYARRLESIMASGAISHRILGYQPWIHEDPALTGLDARWRVFGPEHVLFGTGMPLGGPGVVGDTIADIEALGLPDADAAAIFGGNAGRVLRIPA